MTMQKDPLHDDPSSQWPEEVKKAYEHLEVPSLYDFIVANEKLSLELRKQGKDIKTATEELNTISSKIGSILKILDEDLEIYEVDDEEFDEEDTEAELTDLEMELLDKEQEETKLSVRSILMETTDALVELSKTTKQLTQQLKNLLSKPDKTSNSDWRALSDNVIQSVVDNVDDVRYKIRVKLEEWGIQMIEPQPGESFNSQKHRALEHVSGGQSGTIARVIRVGYTQGNTVLRSAEVIVYD
jgi:molecular chaperone GrpE (heat shock protein)